MADASVHHTELRFIVPDSYNGCLVKVFLRGYCSISAHLLIRLKTVPNGITCNGQHIRVIDTVKAGDIIVIKLPEDECDIKPVNLPIDIVYEDGHILIVNKPPFMPVHPVHGHIDDTLANAVRYYLESVGQSCTFRAVNRIDRDTSGLVLLAKNQYCAALLPGTVDKTYIAVCEGELFNGGRIDKPIRFKEGHTIQREVGEGGVRAVTNWRALKTENGFTLIEIKLETGRTHQIRVHFSDMGHPLAGDDMYGGSRNFINRHALHCAYISFIHPITHEKIEASSQIPEDMSRLIVYDKVI